MRLRPSITLGVLATFALCLLHPAAAFAQKLRVGEAGLLTVEKLIELVALERAKARGVDYEIIAFKSDDVATQAMLNDQVDIIIGSTAYQAIQKLDAPVRHFFQIRPLVYFPVVNASMYDSWDDLNGQEFVVHARGSGTEIIARLQEKEEGIKFSTLTFMPAAQVRATALLQGAKHAAYLNIPALQFLQKEAPGKFVVLPTLQTDASDSTLYARSEFLEANKEKIQILVEELLGTIRRTNADPSYIVEERERLNLLPDLAPEVAEGILEFYQLASSVNLFQNNGGGEAAAKTDFEFLVTAGTMTGDPATLKVEDYWDVGPLNAALAKMGRLETTFEQVK